MPVGHPSGSAKAIAARRAPAKVAHDALGIEPTIVKRDGATARGFGGIARSAISRPRDSATAAGAVLAKSTSAQLQRPSICGRATAGDKRAKQAVMSASQG